MEDLWKLWKTSGQEAWHITSYQRANCRILPISSIHILFSHPNFTTNILSPLYLCLASWETIRSALYRALATVFRLSWIVCHFRQYARLYTVWNLHHWTTLWILFTQKLDNDITIPTAMHTKLITCMRVYITRCTTLVMYSTHNARLVYLQWQLIPSITQSVRLVCAE
jgi:hypothetical protein